MINKIGLHMRITIAYDSFLSYRYTYNDLVTMFFV